MHPEIIFVIHSIRLRNKFAQLTKRQNTSHDDSGDRLRVDRLLGNLSRDLVGAHRVFEGPLAESEVSADEGQWHGHAEPQGEDRDERRERHRARALLVPQHQVHDEEQPEHDAGAEDGRQHHVALPLDSAEALVDSRRHVASRCAEQNEEHHCACHQRTAVSRRQESKAGEGQRDERHAEHLNARAEQHCQQHSVARRPEDVAVNELPA